MRTNARLPLVVCLLLSLLAGVVAAQKRAPDPEESLRLVLDGVRGPGDILRAGAELAELGPAALEALFARLANEATALSTPQRTALTSALGSLPREAVLAFLARVARAPREERERVAGVTLLASFGSRNELMLALDLASSADDEGPLAPSVREALEQALVGICRREQGSALTLAGFFAQVPAALQASIVAALVRAGGVELPGLFAAQLGSGTDADALLLLELGNHATHYGACDDQLVLERVRGYLGHPERRLGVLACLALEKLRDYQAVPDLVVLLDDSNAALSQRAHAALRSLTGLDFGAQTEPWMAWLSPSLDWWDERADAARVALVSGTAAQAAAALADVAAQRLFVADVVQLLELALQRPEPDLVRFGCRALSSLREPCVIHALEQALEHADPALSAEIQHTLTRLARPRPQAHHPPPIPALEKAVTP
ncbi:MAG: hypothetical protein EXS08_14205 [Planctomycetes bacterium]|nr:hypothetical protein [Planctomycetota bacterium]